jgi:hypothetical protein
MPRGRSRLEINEGPVYHETPDKNQIAIVECIMSKRLHDFPITSVEYNEDGLISADRFGMLRTWERVVAA